jgi:DnaK suppressor protein
MKELTRQQMKHLAEILVERAASLESEIRTEIEANSSYGDIAGNVTDLGDEAIADLLADIGNANVSRDIQELRAISAAQLRIKDGTYGSCPDCGKEIVYERLIAYPTAQRCEPCQDRFEKIFAQPAKRTSI